MKLLSYITKRETSIKTKYSFVSIKVKGIMIKILYIKHNEYFCLYNKKQSLNSII